jgi:hypothetical protein
MQVPRPQASTEKIIRPTPETYGPLQQLYDEANAALFQGRLPDCLITLQRKSNSMGFFLPAKFTNGEQVTSDEVTLNPSRIKDLSTVDLLVVFVHLILHVWQYHCGTPGRNGYHNREFAEMAKRIGLYPSTSGEPGGKETGDRISHYIIDGGSFHRFALAMEARGLGLSWFEVAETDQEDRSIDGANGDESEDSKSGKRVRYVCPKLHDESRDGVLKAWAAEGVELACPRHAVILQPG